MSDKLGLRAYGRKQETVFLGKDGTEQRDYSGKTEELIDKYDAVVFAKSGSEIIGGKGGGGRKDFAQAGGQFKDKIDEAFEKIKSLI